MIIIKDKLECIGKEIFLMACSCHELYLQSDVPPWTFQINLDKEMPGFNPQTGIIRCPRCKDTVHKDELFPTKKQVDLQTGVETNE